MQKVALILIFTSLFLVVLTMFGPREGSDTSAYARSSTAGANQLPQDFFHAFRPVATDVRAHE